MANSAEIDADAATPTVDKSQKSKLGLIVKLAIVAAVLAGIFFIPYQKPLRGALEWTQEQGVWGPVFVVFIYIGATVFMIPGSILTLGAGGAFGLLVGTITVSIAATLAACAAFGVGHTFGRKWIEKKFASNVKFAALDGAVARQGFKIVLLTRLSPIFPYTWLNYLYSLTRVSFWNYAFASWIGMLPGTIMYVYLGMVATDAAGGREKTLTERIVQVVGLVITIAVTVYVTRVARKALKEAIPEQES